VVPPADISRERPIVSPIRTDLPKQHSHSGSIGSESDVEARRISQFRKSQASSTRSPHTSSISSSSFIPTPPPPHVELPDHTPVPSFTPAPAYASSSAGPSRPSGSGGGSGSGWGLGLDTQDEMDPETAALIAQLQLEDQEERQREDERRRQLQADEELARKEQQSEAQEWQAHQHEQEQRVRQQREQIIRDESRAVSHSKSMNHMGKEDILINSARLQQRKDGLNKKGRSGVKVLIEAQPIEGGHTTALRNSQMIVGIDVNSGLQLAGWLVEAGRSTTGHAIRVLINIPLSTPCFNLGHINLLLPNIHPKYLLPLIDRMYPPTGSIGVIARLPMLRGD